MKFTKRNRGEIKMKRSLQIIGAILMIATVFMACQTKEVTSAKVYIQQNNWEKAIEQLELATKNYPNDAEAWYLLGEGYGTQEEYEKMVNTFESEITAAKDKYWVNNFNSGVKAINNEDLEGAINAFETAIMIEPERPEAYNNLAITYMRTEDTDKAMDTYERLIKVKPQDVKAMNDLARLYIQEKQYQNAVEVEKKALEIEPSNADAIYSLAMAYDYLGEKDKARAEYQKALEANPKDVDVLFNVARLYFMDGEYDQAIGLFKRVIEQNPDDYDSNLNVGNAFLTMADEYRKTLVEKERNEETITEEEADRLKDMYQQAIPYLEKALSIRDSDPNVWNNLGVAYVNVGNTEKGQEAFDKAETLRQ
jgi:tetratricopeptide (TPR) repeat protein